MCATAEATKGHYACVRALVDVLKLADPGVTTEPRGLTGTQAGPADILTNAAVPWRCAALDVCVASPNAAAAMGDATEGAFKRKLRDYRQVIPELQRAGIAFWPMVWLADGRPHPAVTRTGVCSGAGCQERKWILAGVGSLRRMEARNHGGDCQEACRNGLSSTASPDLTGEIAALREHR